MKLVTFRRACGEEEVGALRGAQVLPLRALGLPHASMNELILHASPEELDTIRRAQGPCLALGDVTLLSPIPRPLQDIVCLGLNYADHAEESVRFHKEAFLADRQAPVFFSKRVCESQGPGAPIPAHADVTQKLDYEAELVVILGRDARNVPPEDAARYVFGYTVCNDVSARDLQTAHKQWYFGKSLDGFFPMGPCIVTADEFPFPPALRITSTVNGELRQSSSTALLLHGVAQIISTLSRGMTLRAGTVIATGTPSGVAMGMETPRFLQPGDTVTCAIEGIGELTNTVV